MAPSKHEVVVGALSIPCLGAVTDECSKGDPPACLAVDEHQASSNTAGARTAARADNDNTPSLATATSLPVLGTHGAAGPEGLDNLVKGLSSPSFHTTLASPHKLAPSAARGAATPVSTAAATAAATTAFALSMTWAPLTAAPGYPPRGTAHLHSAGGLPACVLAPFALDKIAAQPVSSAVAGEEAAATAAADCPQRRVPPSCLHENSEISWPPRSPSLQFSTRRGLYEGTVRGGCIRNTWRYVNAGNSAG